MKTGQYISGAAHVGLILWLLVGIGFDADPLPFDSVSATLVTEEDYAALTALSAPPEAPAEPEAVPEPEPAPEPEPEPEPEPTPEPAPQPAPQPRPAPVQSPEQPQALPDPAAEAAPESTPAPAPRIAPEPAPRPEAPADPDPVPQVAVEPVEAPEPAPAPEPRDAAVPEESSTRIVTEAEERPQTAPTTSPRPLPRPSRPVPPEPEETPVETVAEAEPEPTPEPEPELTPEPEPEPAPEPDAEPEAPLFDDAVAAALAEALGGAGTTPDAPATLSQAEADSLRLAVSACWNVGSLSSDALGVTVIVALEFARDGRPIADTIRMVSASGGGGDATRQAFETARRAILRCGTEGYDLPPQQYDLWKSIEMVFDPEKMRRL
ncbi:energy transducer TonB [Poseidonocella sedimentorum]|uniref:Cell division and transport-associated protein TolA n=1 Tax=Poseidonocella sedimentorum TaxID=871652 RepID=A0A1I6EF96_9RHOB|nr:energy transducer TonB [Poseidonocella sedimentorum]SFR16449.1 hypothetical protein SAMN04515673_11151 [Poseidonocella sedimentorum]